MHGMSWTLLSRSTGVQLKVGKMGILGESLNR